MAFREFILITGFIFLQITLSNAINCYSCDSRNDSNCATFKSSLEQEQIACDDSDTCAIWIDGINTFRGCKSSIPEGITEFHSCNTHRCNRIFYPEDRLQCVTCSSDDISCLAVSDDDSFPCKNYVENDSCYTYIINETSAIRGCMSDEDDNVKTCNDNGETCIKCPEEICRNIQPVTSYISCLSCSSETDESCGYTQEEAQDNVSKQKICSALLGRENSCFAFGNEPHFVRGCLNEYPEFAEICSEIDENCHVCSEHVCNSRKIIEEFCYMCDSITDEDCKNVAKDLTQTICGEGTINKSGCYLSDKDGMIQRGCVTSLSERELEECQAGEVCKICKGNMCNTKPSFQKCYTCDSRDDTNCATLRGALPEKICDDYLDTCKVYVVPNMTTHRGCFNEMLSDNVECSPLSNNCKQCDEMSCNGEVFPSNRLLCHHCESSNSDDSCYKSLENNTELSYPCETYNFRDFCYFNITENGKVKTVHRGCLSDVGTEKCVSDQEQCKTCQSSNCNSESIMKTSTISCVTCDTSGEIECKWGLKESYANKCRKDYYFYEKESCYTMAFSDQAIRGCTLDGNVCRSSNYCTLCEEDACNRFNVAQQFCYECSSDVDKNCGPEPFHVMNTTCSGVIDYAHRGCYTWDLGNNNITRGCYNDLTADQKVNCTRDEKNCVYCFDSPNCNDEKKGSGFTISVNIALVSFSLVLSFVTK